MNIMVSAGGSKMRPSPQGQRPAMALKKLVLLSCRLPIIRTRSATRARGGRGDADLVEHEPVVGRRNKLDAACLAADLVHLDKRQTEARDTQKRGPPIGDRIKIINEPAQRLLHLIEGPDRHHQSAE
jgi:hypothetical protein